MAELKQDLIDTLQMEGTRTQALFAALSETAWSVVVYTDPLLWTPREVLIHLIDAERNFVLILENVAQGGPGVPEGYDINAHNARAVARLSDKWQDRDTAALIATFGEARGSLLAHVQGLRDDDMARIVRHPLIGVVPTSDFLRAVYLHAKIHGRDIKRALEARQTDQA